MAKMGRPTIEIDWEKLESVCRFPFTQAEIAWLLGVSKSSLERKIPEKYGITFDELQCEKRNELKRALHNKQYEVAMKGSIPMLIWLGKQHLGQSDKQESLADIKKTITLKYRDDEEDEQHPEPKPV